jgi:hypothetical protein
MTLSENQKDEYLEAFRATVQSIENGIATTRNHYGEYMAVLSIVDSSKRKRILADTLIACGANRQGVADALRLS